MKKIFYLFYKIINPVSQDEDRNRRELILNILLVSIITLLSAAITNNILKELFSNPIEYENNAMPITSLLVTLTFFVILYILSKNKFSLLSSYLFISILFLLSFYIIYCWGVEVPSGSLLFVTTIVMSGILVNTRFAFFIALLSSLTLMAVDVLQIKSIITPNLYWKKNETIDFSEAIFFSIFFFIIATLSWLSNREIEKSLKRARKSEADLKIERDMLEIRVEERTRELRKTQMEKMSQLYRFAEFGRLSSGLFHDLINPLTAVSLNLSQIKESDKKELKQARDYLEKAVQATKKMEEFIIAIRKQIQKKQTKADFSLTEEIIQTIQILSYKARKKQVEVIFDARKNYELFGDSVKFSQIIINLISNAIDAYEDTDLPDKKVEIKLEETMEELKLSVKDRGKGIKQEHQEKIFEPFFTTKENMLESGMGIGLSSTKNIIERDFGGSIRVKSEEGQGAEFIIKIPKE